jgi:hypothetical protein
LNVSKTPISLEFFIKKCVLKKYPISQKVFVKLAKIVGKNTVGNSPHRRSTS